MSQGVITAGDPEDVIRSLRRYVALMLGSPPWRVRLQRTRIADDERPAAVVEASSGISTPQSRAGTLSQGDVQKAQTFTAVCYPSIEMTAEEARQSAGLLASLLDAGFSRGLVTDDDPPVNIGGPWRVPLFSFAGVPIRGDGRAGPDEPYGYADVGGAFNVRAVQDALDELRFTVVATVPLTWWQGGRIEWRGPVVAQDGVSGGWLPQRP